jgi:hypothetical protein
MESVVHVVDTIDIPAQLPPTTSVRSSSSSGGGHSHWWIFGQKFPKNEVVFFVQIIIVYVVILTSLVNLTLQRGDNSGEQKLWIALLSSSLGYLLPNPSIRP